jgi:Polyketide synthase dehydratase
VAGDQSGVAELKIQIDPLTDTFLLDYVVAGAPLLPTVMQLDLVARVLLACYADWRAPAGITLRDVAVGAPVRFDRPGPRELHRVSRRCGPGPDAFRCKLRSPDEPAAHMTAVAERILRPVPAARNAGARASRLPGGPDLVYPPFFHGAAFAVVGGFGRSAAGLNARLAAGLPSLRWAAAGTVLRPRLLELLLQCCGLWELADSGRMMVPAAIELVHWHPDSLAAETSEPAEPAEPAEPTDPAVACVVPRPGPGDGSRVFDGQVLGPGGSVLVTVAGYRTTDLGLVPDLAHAARLSRCLDAPYLDAPHLDAMPAAGPATPLTAAVVAGEGAPQ